MLSCLLLLLIDWYPKFTENHFCYKRKMVDCKWLIGLLSTHTTLASLPYISPAGPNLPPSTHTHVGRA